MIAFGRLTPPSLPLVQLPSVQRSCLGEVHEAQVNPILSEGWVPRPKILIVLSPVRGLEAKQAEEFLGVWPVPQHDSHPAKVPMDSASSRNTFAESIQSNGNAGWSGTDPGIQGHFQVNSRSFQGQPRGILPGFCWGRGTPRPGYLPSIGVPL